MAEANKVFDPLRELEAQLEQSEGYVTGCSADVIALTERLSRAKEIMKDARRERDNLKRAIICLKRAGFCRE